MTSISYQLQDSYTLSEQGTFCGYASVFGVVDAYKDVIEPGAFKQCLAQKKAEDISLLWQHKSDEPIGVCSCVEEHDNGLWLEASLLLDIQRAHEAYVLLKHRAIIGLSIGFKPIEFHYNNAHTIRHITEIDLLEISLVTFPANQSACVTEVKTQPDSRQLNLEHQLTDVLYNAMSILKGE